LTRFAFSRTGPVLACACALAAGLAAQPPAADARGKLGDRTLRKGSHGRDVRALQRSLTRLGHRTVADGVYGRATRRSVRRYERAETLRADGVVSRPQGRGIRMRVRRLRAARRPAVAPATPVTLAADGRTAVAPPDAPPEVQAAVAAANRITDKPYRYGGGHGRWEDRGYDCSGAVSYVLHGAGLLDGALASGGFMSWGAPGRGRWITVYAHGGHAYMVVGGLRYDTSGSGERGPRWRPEPRSGRGYRVRHREGL
jgi:peptidoglycan hydrolase-like protein with peptidoglycan-binding domain